jgi:hypothetical protein
MLSLRSSYGVVFILLVTLPAQAIVLHPDDAQPDNRPDGAVGRWSADASCVAVGRSNWITTNYILTTRYQGGSTGVSVYFGEVEYTVAEVFNAPVTKIGCPTDLRICRLETADGREANLTDFVPWYEGTDEIGKTVVLGGYGRMRGASGTDAEGREFYEWAGADNTTLTWGANSVLSAHNGYGRAEFRSFTLTLEFDEPDSQDAALAEWDFGGGWFYNDGGTWKVVGISAYAETPNRSFYGSSNPESFGDTNWAIRISSYAEWIDTTIPKSHTPEPVMLPALGVGAAVMAGRRRRAR